MNEIIKKHLDQQAIGGSGGYEFYQDLHEKITFGLSQLYLGGFNINPFNWSKDIETPDTNTVIFYYYSGYDIHPLWERMVRHNIEAYLKEMDGSNHYSMINCNALIITFEFEQ